jgi:hypothetical protein
MAKRSCYDCASCVWDKGLWLRSLGSGFPARPMCANHPDTPGTLREVPVDGVCRNFKEKPGAGRVEPPQPPNDDVRYIPLTKGKFAIVDAEDYEWLSKHKWYAQARSDGKGFYAVRNSHDHTVQMHREIMQTPKGMVVDHRNGNGADNRRGNMRNCKQDQNRLNSRPWARGSSDFVGVFRKGNKWQAEFTYKRKKHYLGLYDDPVEAAKVRDRKAYELAGEFAYLNFPEDFKGKRKRRAAKGKRGGRH